MVETFGLSWVLKWIKELILKNHAKVAQFKKVVIIKKKEKDIPGYKVHHTGGIFPL